MNSNRRLQLSAASVIATGSLALLTMPTSSAEVSCLDWDPAGCSIFQTCPTDMNQVCAAMAPPGCTVASTWCMYDPGFIYCDGPGIAIGCSYE